MPPRELSITERIDVGRRVREEIARRRISRQTLAAKARVSLSTLEKALTGTRPFSLATVIRIEETLGVSLRSPQQVNGHSEAPDHLGAYSRPAVRWIEGRYVTIRPSFDGSGSLYAYMTEIMWDETQGHLGFAESGRVDAKFEQSGDVSLSNLSGQIYLVTNAGGQYRMMILSRPTIEGAMYGVLTTLKVGHGSQLVPISCPIALVRHHDLTEPKLGVFTSDMVPFAAYRAVLDTVIGQDFGRIVR